MHSFPFPVDRVVDNTKDVTSGSFYLATSPEHALSHIQQALQAGAVGIIAKPDICVQIQEVQTFCDENPRLTLSRIAALRYPLQPTYLTAVTGTNGKTSVVHFLKQICEISDFKSASLGTLGLLTSHPFEAPEALSNLTSYGPLPFHHTLQSLAQNGFEHVCFEASSHGLDQNRIDGARLKAAAFTNFTQDHLDYHGTMNAYWEAKIRLLTEVLPATQTAVLSLWDSRVNALKHMLQHPLITTGIEMKEADIKALNVHADMNTQRCDLHIFGEIFKDVLIPIAGRYQLENILTAAGLSHACGLSIDTIITSLAHLTPVRGRLESVGSVHKHVFVDYAHTPDALESVLNILRTHTKGKLYVVFGCGGNRDNLKRPLMGAIAHQKADVVVITNDNPRFEKACDIRTQILNAAPNSFEIEDRREAIRFCLERMNANDILLVAGKGHETGQIVGDVIHPFDDAKVVQEIIHQMEVEPCT